MSPLFFIKSVENIDYPMGYFNDKLKSLPMTYLEGSIKFINTLNSRFIYCCYIEPIIPRVYLLGLILGFITFLFARGFTWWYMPSILILSTYILWTKYFYYFLLKKGLKKKGFNGGVSFLSKHDGLMLLLGKI